MIKDIKNGRNRSCILLLAATFTLCTACQADQSPSAIQTVNENVSLDDLAAPSLNFTKGDQTESAKLYNAINLGEARAVEGALTKVFPLALEQGDELSISAWSDQGSALFVYQPHNVEALWVNEAKRALTAEVKEGLERLTVNFSAEESGQYALVLQGRRDFTRDIVSITCLSGPCSVASQEQSDLERAEESQEATEQIEAELSESVPE